MPHQSDREVCCDGKISTPAGRDFCYNEIIYSDVHFKECDFPTYSQMFACCDDFGKGDQQLIYDCKTNLPGGGTCNDEADCKNNYKIGLEVIEAEKLKGGDDDDGD